MVSLKSNLYENLRITGLPFFCTLWIDGSPQSGGLYHAMWRRILKPYGDHNFTSILLLGLGGGTAIQDLLKSHPNSKITAIEIDPAVAKLSHTHFLGKLTDRLDIIIADAQTWVSKNTQKSRYDLLIVDLYTGELNPGFARTKKFLSQLKPLITNAGFIIFNSHYQANHDHDLTRFLKLCRSLYQTKVIHQSVGNRILELTPLNQ